MRNRLAPPRPRTRRLAVGLLAAALLATQAVGCSDDDGPDASSIRSLLELVPDTEANRSSLQIVLYQKAREAADLDEPGDSSKEQLRQMALLSADVDTGTGTGSLPLAAGRNAVDQFGELGYLPSDVEAEISAGRPPDVLAIGIGSFDRDAVLDAAAKVDGATRTKIWNVDTVRWLFDRQVEPDLDTPVGDLPGQAGRVAVPTDDVLVYAHSDEDARAGIVRARGNGKTLGDDDGLVAVAESLDRLDVHAAFLSTEPVHAGQGAGSRLTPDQVEELDLGDGLPPYRAYGVGAALGDDGPELVVVLSYATSGDAVRASVQLERTARDGRSAATGQPWSDLLGDADVNIHDDLVVEARFPVENPTLWYQVVSQQDTLLATS